MSEIEIFRSTLFCAIGGIALGAVLGFLNGWARARYMGERKAPAWLEPATTAHSLGSISARRRTS